mgnify:CR=1 FL=1
MAVSILDTVEPDLAFQRLVAHGEASGDLRINPKALRPCVGVMFRSSFHKGDIPNRSDISAVIAAELVKIGYDRERILYELTRWNKGNNPPIKQSALQSTVRTALRKNYNYSCRHPNLKEFCVGSDMCSYAKGQSNQSKFNFRIFFKYRWQLILSHKSKLVYWLALPELEKQKGQKPGSVIYENHTEIAKMAGITPKYVKSALKELAGYGLIWYKPGIPRKWEGKATEIQRIFPIPKPPREAVLKVTNDA